jgi:hypothetical protein
MMEEKITWWIKGAQKGVFVQTIESSEHGRVLSSSGQIPDGASVVTEEEFADLLRAEYVQYCDTWRSERALIAAKIEQMVAERENRVNELISLGFSRDSAESIVPPPPSLVGRNGYNPPPGSAEFLRSAYRLSNKSITRILAPVEG